MSSSVSTTLQLRLEKTLEQFYKDFPRTPMSQILGVLELTRFNILQELLEASEDDEEDLCDDSFVG